MNGFFIQRRTKTKDVISYYTENPIEAVEKYALALKDKQHNEDLLVAFIYEDSNFAVTYDDPPEYALIVLSDISDPQIIFYNEELDEETRKHILSVKIQLPSVCEVMFYSLKIMRITDKIYKTSNE